MELGAELIEHQIVALPRQRRIGARAGIFDRAADHDPARAIGERRAAMRDQPLQEQTAEILEPERASENLRALEQRARRDALERLDEAAVERRLQIFRDRPWPRLRRNAVPAALLLPEAQGGPEYRARRAVTGKIDQARPPVALGERDNAVGRAEVEPQRGRDGHDGSFSGSPPRRGGAYGMMNQRRQATVVSAVSVSGPNRRRTAGREPREDGVV